MQADIDMSGRLEETARPTALALANSLAASIRITAREKRIILETLALRKPQWSRTHIHILVFSTLLYLLLKDHVEKLNLIVIDLEFTGYESLIKDRVMTLCRRQGITVRKDQFTFRRVGKKSPAHKLAFEVYKGSIRPDRVIMAKDVLAAFRN